ncbi:MAG: S8 family serine peptidase [Pyrinomonadaceae bacterium]
MKVFFSVTRMALLFAVGCSAFGIYWSSDGAVQKAQEIQTQPFKARFSEFEKSDAITDDIRNTRRQTFRVRMTDEKDRAAAANYGSIIGDYGTFVVLSKDKKTSLARSGLDTQEIDTALYLPGTKFDPVAEPPEYTVRPDQSPRKNGEGYYIVQFGGTVNDAWLDSVRDAGVEILQYIPNQAFFVYGDAANIQRVSGHSRIRWVGEHRKEHKISRELRDFNQRTKGETAAYDIAVFARADLDGFAGEFTNFIRGRILSRSKLPNNFFNILRVEVQIEEIEKIAEMPDVIRIDPFIAPAREDERAAQIVAGNYTSTTTLAGPGYNPLTRFGADGTGVTVAVSDDGISIPGNGGFYISSANTVNAPLRGATAGASGGHGHLNASIIAGDAPFGILDPTGYNYGLGIAPKANIVNIPFLKSGNTTTDAQAVNDALNTLGPNGVKATISNNSWGSGTNSNSYDSYAAQYDGLVRDGSFATSIDPFTIVFSAGNSGPGASTLTRPKVAKNVISVGNSENIRTEFGGANADNIEDLRSSSSRGPSADGRIKPDITAPGTFITGSRAGSCSSVGLCFDANHAYSTGTSHAAPQVAGAAALFTQYWRNANAGIYPSPAMIKAAVISSAQEMNGANTSAAVPNGDEGWGRISMKFMMNTGVGMKYIDQSSAFSNPGETQIVSGAVGDSTKPVRVTLVWTDPPGVSDPALVNNLDLTVTVGGNTYKGNVFSGGASAAGGASDTINNVENVFLPAGIPAGTPFTISIGSTALNGDGILGNADTTDQHFALVAYNFSLVPTAATAEISGRVVSGSGRGIANALITLTDSHGAAFTARTGSFGYYIFENIAVGQTYVATVLKKRYTFEIRTLNVDDNIAGLNFVSGEL